MMHSDPFWAWPGWKHIRLAIIVSLLGSLWFVLVYGGCDVVTAHRATRIRIHLDSELNIPFVPEAVVIYMSIYLLFFAAPFILRQTREFLTLAMALDTIILIGGIGFLLIPAQLAFAPEANLGAFPRLFHFADRLNLTYNLVPSLHVALSVACLATYASRAGRFLKAILWLWALAISASTLLTHQHHILDVVAGWIVALTVMAIARVWMTETTKVPVPERQPALVSRCKAPVRKPLINTQLQLGETTSQRPNPTF